ncbi:adenylate/guanylate cyclase domain-containing protein [Bradyrhizobium canariense]|uniref:SAM domain (Sterile alpha motif) n=1 Tax=Bradyrhizobium canariense TaxID=255045 RepID=A0A1H1XF81_9BRAD|nr:adenylate/guanylate cyclase domain-containing protein [Bradyrhizobium canariense]SDT07801.1 SAM domain (Sterile alpha motif) [Bradyrhizobium canariense]
MDVATWLNGLGLGQYEAVFRENEIDGDVLSELTDQHLKDLGVSLGHRLKILRAIREQRASGSKPQDAADRRQLTIMFCDLVDSTALTAQLDPEDMADLIRAFQRTIAAAIARFDGHVAKWLGDGATIYFGYPRAHEDDAERAARAGIALVEAVGELRCERGVELRVRIGISTGLVIVGELIGEGDARERGVVGDTPNLASRLQAVAEPDTVVVSESTRRLLGKAFELKALGPQELKGFKAPVPAWSVMHEIENVSRFEASRSETMTPFVGREHEVGILLDRWRRATTGEGQVTLLSGEAGIGKSRVLAMLRERIGDERHMVLRYQCSPHHINDAFYPVIGQIWRGAGFVSGEPAAARLQKLEMMIARSGLDCRDIVPYFASLLAIPTEGRYPVVEMAPSEFKERATAAMIAIAAAVAETMPLLVVLEDAHWIDPTSLELLGQLVERVRHLPVLIVVTFRPEFAVPQLDHAQVTNLSLNRFGRTQAVTMIDQITSGKPLPAEVLDQIVAKTDGVPLFVEELTKSVLESGLLREESGVYVLAAMLTPLAIPSTLHDSLTARLDRLSPIKEIAQIGAVIGREFPRSLLEAVSPIKGRQLQDALRQLMESELIYERGTGPMTSYIFKHALVQDTAYVSLLRGRRQRIHADIAQALKQRDATEESVPAVIAYHFTEAGLAEPAASYWLAAAEQALSQSAPVEAERHASTGLTLVPRIKAGPERDALELALLVARANALVPLKSMSASETFEAVTAAKQLLDRGIGTDLQRISVLYGLCTGNTLRARMVPAFDLARQIIDIAERQDDPTYYLVGYRLLGTLQFYAGQNRDALESLRKGGKYRDPRRQRALSYRFGWDPSLAVVCYEVLVRLSLGLFDSAARLSEEVRAELLDHPHPPTIATVTFCGGTWPKAVLADLKGLERDSAALVAYCTENKVEQIRLLAGLHQAYARAVREPVQTNIAFIHDALEAVRRSGSNAGNSILISNLAEALLVGGDLAGAEAALTDAFAFVEQSGEGYWLADMHRLSGHVALRQPEPDRTRAETCFVKAIEVARRQEARLLELRAATDLAQLWRDTQSGSDPRALLEPILAAIEGGETTRDVRNARALLAEFV